MTHQVVLYTKAGCCLCDRAKQVLARLQGEFGLEIQEVDVAGDAELLACYGEIIPVVVIDGQTRFESKIAEHYLRRALTASEAPTRRWPWQHLPSPFGRGVDMPSGMSTG